MGFNATEMRWWPGAPPRTPYAGAFLRSPKTLAKLQGTAARRERERREGKELGGKGIRREEKGEERG